MRPFRLVVVGGTAFAVIAMLLPFASFPVVGPVDGITADAWPALLPLLLTAIVIIGGRWGDGLEPAAALVAVASSAAALVFGIVKLTDAVLAVRASAGATMGPGAYVLLASIVVAVGGATAGALAR